MLAHNKSSTDASDFTDLLKMAVVPHHHSTGWEEDTKIKENQRHMIPLETYIQNFHLKLYYLNITWPLRIAACAFQRKWMSILTVDTSFEPQILTDLPLQLFTCQHTYSTYFLQSEFLIYHYGLCNVAQGLRYPHKLKKLTGKPFLDRHNWMVKWWN